MPEQKLAFRKFYIFYTNRSGTISEKERTTMVRLAIYKNRFFNVQLEVNGTSVAILFIKW